MSSEFYMATRRTLIKGSLALPMLPAMSIGFAGCSDNSPNPYLAANYGPVDIESTVTDLKVTGTIPAELSGRFPVSYTHLTLPTKA